MAEMRSYTYEKGFWLINILKGIKINFSKRDFAALCVGFLLAMASPLPNLAPFGMAYLAQERKLKLKSFFIFLAVSLGAFVACGRLGGAKYTAAGLIYIGCLFVLKRGVVLNDLTSGLIAGAAILISGIGALVLEGITVLGVVLLLCEVAVAVSATLMMEKSIQALSQKDFSPKDMDSDTRLSLCAVVLIALLGFQNVYLGSSLSIMMIAATVMLLMVSLGCGAEYSAGAGVILGVVCGIGSDFFMPILGAFCFCGFLSGVFSKFGKGGVIAGVILANGVMAVYTASAMESALSLYEVLVASAIFALVPASWTNRAKQLICFDKDKNENIARLKSVLITKLNSVASAMEHMAKTVSGFSSKEYENPQEISVIFDRTAEKVCKKCRKSDVCWGKDFDSTYDELFKLLEILQAKGVAKPEDISERLAAKCPGTGKLLEELNHQFDMYRINQVCSSKIQESRKLMAGQLGSVSDIIEKLSRDIDAERGEEVVSAYEIRSKLEMSGIKVRDVNVFELPHDRLRVELIVKSGIAQGKDRRTIEKIVKSISGCSRMAKEDVLENKKLTRLVFTAEERFAVEAECASRSVDKENGDNYRMIHLKGGKYVIALSDGMGTGKGAARESRAILELVDSFLEAGFDCRTAVKMINSIMLMRSEENFVTLDLCIIDLYTGEVDFIKTGAEPSFILGSGGRVRKVKAASLPIGLVAEAKADVSTTKIQGGDKIVMMTDGVSMSEQKSPWFDGFLRENTKTDGQISEEILNRAIQQSRGLVKDDMTVVTVHLKAVG